MTENPHREVHGHTCYEVARQIAIKLRQTPFAPPSQSERERAVEYLERVVDEFANIPHWRYGSLGEAARRYLFELRNLDVGAIAPEVTGTDTDGDAMAFSDFR